ncbi:S41 family peptidase [Thermostilla marina]
MRRIGHVLLGQFLAWCIVWSPSLTAAQTIRIVEPQAAVGAAPELLPVAPNAPAPTVLPHQAVGSEAADPAITELLVRGAALERQAQWGEAVALYEEALREYPDLPILQQRFTEARLHFDLIRRCGDHSYISLVTRTDRDAAMALYDETLVKLQSHYVDTPHWSEIVERGTHELEIALDEPLFRTAFLPNVSLDVVEGFAARLHEYAARQVIRTRADARDTVAVISRLASQQLRIPESAVVFEFICGAVNSLDMYSAFLTPKQLNDIYSQIEGNFVGLGVELKAENGALTIVRVIPGSPAEAAGIRPQDRIVSVDGRTTAEVSTDQAADMLQGPEGSRVQLGVVSPGAEPRVVTVERRRVEVPSVTDAKILDPATGTAYLKITSFQRTTAHDLETALWDLYRKGMRSLIIDLRGNPGGLLVAGVEAADKFIERGVVVTTQGRNRQENFTYTANEAGTWRVPLIVIIDRDSASAAEIFAGAIHDHGRGTIVGTRSYGKGSVQGIFPLADGSSGLRLTTAKFFSPKGQPYSHVGVNPDLLVRTTARPIDGWQPAGSTPSEASSTRDVMLEAAVNAARQLTAQRTTDAR